MSPQDQGSLQAQKSRMRGKTPLSFVKVWHFLISKDENECSSNGSTPIVKMFVVHGGKEAHRP